MSDAVQAQLRIASGVHSVNKLFCLPCPHAAPQLQPTCAMPITAAVNEGEPQHEMSEGRQLNKRIPEVGVVVFFVGDQLEAMGLPPRVLELQNPRAQAALMADKFRGSAVAVVVPSRYEGGCASYDHFLHRTTATGEPLGYAAGGSAGFKAAAQLASLLTSVGLWPSGCKLSGGQKAPLTSTGATSEAAVGPSTSKLSVAVPVAVHLVGFSKGGVVLNQLLTELAEFSQPTQRYTGSKPLRPAVPLFSDLPRHPAGVPVGGENVTSRTAPAPLKEADERTAELLRSIQCVHYLDAGLNGRGGYLTDLSVAEGLKAATAAQPGLHICLHGTPRQWDDPLRPWLPVEKNRMLANLRAAGVPVTERKYFEGQAPSVLMHFESIAAMDTCLPLQ